MTSFAEANDIPVLSFAGKRDKGRPGVLAESPWPERKIDRVMPLMRKAAATGRSQVVAIGVAQEYQRVFTGTRDQTPTGAVSGFPALSPNSHRARRTVSGQDALPANLAPASPNRPDSRCWSR